jgi:RNA polymerase I specific transcription initiation factor
MAESPTSRPNRWTGPPSTWRSYTREERGVVTSLDTIRSQDLSIHLYNAHAIKSRVRHSRGKGKAKSTGDDESEFVPPDLWTAWPMSADEVPRDPYLPNGGGKRAWRLDEDARQSANLEEALLATTTRIARERWRARKWEWSGSKVDDTVKDGAMADEPMSERSTIETDETGRPMFSSHAFDLLGNANSSPDEDEEVNSDDASKLERRPVPLADDDRARQLLLPSIRHIISKADNLLVGLQKAREAYAGNWNKSKGDATTSGEETDIGAETSRGRGRSSRSRKRARASSGDSEASVRSTSSKSSKGKHSSTKQLKLRDWSDVIGMATLTGWDPDVVQRAAERCSSLFKEDMLLRTFDEGYRGEKSYFTDQLASGKDPEASPAEEIAEDFKSIPATEPALRIPAKEKFDEAGSGASVTTGHIIRCPVETCPGHNMVYARAKNMYDHVRKFHPEVDIRELKTLEARRKGDRRGKWDRSRHRSSSQADSSQ